MPREAQHEASQNRLVDLGGYRLAIEVTGNGTPPVVCLSCAGGAHSEWEQFVPLVASTTSCLTYGRPGLGGSDPLRAEDADAARGARWAAEQLRALLRAADFAPPVVLVTGSIGAWVADQYAARYPSDVAGMVLIDPTYSTPFPVSEPVDVVADGGPDGIQWSRQRCFAEFAEARPGIRGRNVVLSSAVGRWLRTEPRPWHQPLTLAEVDEIWQEKQREWAERLDAVHVVADSAGHFVHKDEPELAAYIVRAVLDAVREDRDVNLDLASLADVGASLHRAAEYRGREAS